MKNYIFAFASIQNIMFTLNLYIYIYIFQIFLLYILLPLYIVYNL